MKRRGQNLRKGLLRTILPVLRRFPLPMATRMLSGIGKTEYALLSELREKFREAVGRSREQLGCDWDVVSVSRELAGNQVRWRMRDMLLDVPAHRLGPILQVDGREHLDGALARGTGVILLANHFGGHLLPAHWLFREGYALRFFMERPRHVSKYLNRQFQTDGPLGQDKLFISRKGNPTGSAGSILRAAKILRAGMLVYIAGDVRWSGQHSQPARFMGKMHRFSATWINLAALTSAPVVPVFCRMLPDGTYRVEFRAALHVGPDAPKTDEARRLVEGFLRMLEELVRLYPDNSNEYFFWAEPEERAA